MKKYGVAGFVLFCLVSAFAQKSPYAGAPADTQVLLKRADELIQKKQYESAFGALNGGSDEFVLAKKIEIAINYFAQSIMHHLFAFKDLEQGETLYDVRTGTGTYSTVPFDLVKAVEAYEKQNGEKPILHYALGLYYDDVLLRYGDQWLLSEKELAQKTGERLQKAVDKDCCDARSLSVLALAYYKTGDLTHAEKIYNQKIEAGFECSANDYFNLGAIYLQKKHFASALHYAEKSIERYKDEPEYQSDAYIMCADSCLGLHDYKKAESFLKTAEKRFPKDYRIAQKAIALYAAQKNKKEALKAAKNLFALAPENPAASQMIIRECYTAGMEKWLPDFFDDCLKTYSKSGRARQNLLYHYAYTLHEFGDTEQASRMAKSAKAEFIKNGELTAKIENTLDSFGK
ncbi:MAG: tetratricopeptide repeat protein [Treponema sp.]